MFDFYLTATYLGAIVAVLGWRIVVSRFAGGGEPGTLLDVLDRLTDSHTERTIDALEATESSTREGALSVPTELAGRLSPPESPAGDAPRRESDAP